MVSWGALSKSIKSFISHTACQELTCMDVLMGLNADWFAVLAPADPKLSSNHHECAMHSNSLRSAGSF